MTATERVRARYVEPDKTGFRFRDFLVILLCLFIVGFFINLFRLDLFQTINLQNAEPVGTITIKNNTVQRRIADRVLWDRLIIESPVYLGDIIRVADMSSAVLNIEGQQLDIGENTLIRIQLAPNGEGLQIELSEGNIGITVTEESVNQGFTPLALNMNGRVVETTAGTSVTASSSNRGTAVQVNEGTVIFIEGNTIREITSGEQLALDYAGTEILLPSVVVTHPLPNARYIKSTTQSVPVIFSWNRINLQPQDLIRLEIATDRNFSRDVKIFNNLNNSAQTEFAEILLEAGNWNWRFIYGDLILSTGRLTVVEAAGLELQSPARGSLFRYETEPPSVRFQWSEIEEASNYIIEISSALNFENPKITRQIAASFFTLQGVQSASLQEGTWYWRVKPVFSSSFSGYTEFSHVSFFITEQNATVSPENKITMLAIEQTAEIEQIINPMPIIETIPEPEPPPLFAVPANRIPANRHVYGIEQLRTQRNIVFSWSAVQGTNAYIVTLFQQTATGRRLINSVAVTGTRWTLNDISILERGTFIWQVEAVTRSANGTIERRGRTGENSFTMDIPSPNPVQADNPGVLYGY